MSDELLELVGLDAEDHEAQEAMADAEAVSALITTLVTIRRTTGLSQKAVAERMATTQSAVSELERIATDPHISTLQRFGRAVGARLAWKVVLDGGWTNLSSKVSADAEVDDSEWDERPSDAPWEEFAHGRTAIQLVC